MVTHKNQFIENEKVFWHAMPLPEVFKNLNSSQAYGLNRVQILERINLYGKNVLPEKTSRSVWRMLIDQFTDFMVLVLIGAAIISAFMGEGEDTIAISIIILLNATLGFIQEYRSEKAMAALKALTKTQATVLREGNVKSLIADELTLGDIVILEAGAKVPADLRLVETAQLSIEEAALTGESLSSEKDAHKVIVKDAALGDRHNMAFKGTVVSNGRGLGVVVAVGLKTEIGKIAGLLQAQEDSKTPLQKRLAIFGRRLALLVIALCAFIFIGGLIRGAAPFLMFMTALSLAVAAIPEALPAVVTLSLAIGAKRMIRQNALIRRLPAVETLGSVTYICSDKTGTLTQNKMKVAKIFAAPEMQEEIYRIMFLNNDAKEDSNGNFLGDPTEIALSIAAKESGLNATTLNTNYPRVAEIPFSSESRLMTTVHHTPKGNFEVLVKGAPEKVLSLCCFADDSTKENTLKEAQTMAQNGLRVLAFAGHKVDEKPTAITNENLHGNLQFYALTGLLDPPRGEVKQAIGVCQNASINVVMITGDHPATALAIARELGIVKPDSPVTGGDSVVISGPEFSNLTDEEYYPRVHSLRVYARVSPEQKIRIVKALQEKGEFVAMTGDGVNDAPALKRADIGVSMGKIGTDVAREASHMVLLDDNFSTIVNAVREGRRIFDNIRKFVKFVLTGNAAEILTILLASLFGLPVPFLPIHILWINLVTDGLPGLALSTEPDESKIMQRPPRPPSESIFAHGIWQHTLWAGTFMSLLCLSVGAIFYHRGNDHWQTMMFMTLTSAQMFHVLAIRSERESIFKQGLFSNNWLLLTVIATFLVQIAVLYVPFANAILKIHPLEWSELGICLILSSTILIFIELEKWAIRKGWIYQ